MDKENIKKDILDFLSAHGITKTTLNLYLNKRAGKTFEELSEKALLFLFNFIGEISIEIEHFLSKEMSS